jgi:hypothetical protein
MGQLKGQEEDRLDGENQDKFKAKAAKKINNRQIKHKRLA